MRADSFATSSFTYLICKSLANNDAVSIMLIATAVDSQVALWLATYKAPRKGDTGKVTPPQASERAFTRGLVHQSCGAATFRKIVQGSLTEKGRKLCKRGVFESTLRQDSSSCIIG